MAKQSARSAKAKRPQAKAGAAKPPADAAPEAPKPKRKVGPVEFLRQVRQEGAKVTWTTRNEMIVSTVMVLIMVAFASVFFFGVDQALKWGVNQILSINLAGIL
ncbi:MAG: preprotein translocase subunit SecE [Pseudomonadota bacterium]